MTGLDFDVGLCVKFKRTSNEEICNEIQLLEGYNHHQDQENKNFHNSNKFNTYNKEDVDHFALYEIHEEITKEKKNSIEEMEKMVALDLYIKIFNKDRSNIFVSENGDTFNHLNDVDGDISQANDKLKMNYIVYENKKNCPVNIFVLYYNIRISTFIVLNKNEVKKRRNRICCSYNICDIKKIHIKKKNKISF